MVVAHYPFTIQGGDEGDAPILEQGGEFGLCTTADRAKTNQRKDFLALRESIRQRGGRLRNARGCGHDWSDLQINIVIMVHRHAAVSEVFRDVDMHWPGPPFESQIDRLL